jgi:hypothetical protein
MTWGPPPDKEETISRTISENGENGKIIATISEKINAYECFALDICGKIDLRSTPSTTPNPYFGMMIGSTPLLFIPVDLQ